MPRGSDDPLLVLTPADVAMRMLAHRFGRARPAARHPALELFQQDALERLDEIIARRGGAVLADSVGLGKTHVAVALVRDALAQGRRIIVVAPAQLRGHWERHLRGVSGWRWLSHTTLSRRSPRAAADASHFVVVDEAHAFRNPATRRYRALAALCEHAQVLLLTATPACNSIHDCYHLLRLFAARDAFGDVGVPDLLVAFDAAAHGDDPGPLRRVAEAVMVRRTRRAVQRWLSANGTAAPRLTFPTRAPLRHVRYAAGAEAARPSALCRHLRALRFTAHAAADRAATPELLRLGLLKRLESGAAAFHASVLRHIRLLEHFIHAAEAGLLFDVRTDAALASALDGAVQLHFERLTLQPWPGTRSRADAIRHARADLQRLRAALELIPAGRADPKLARLKALLDGELSNQKVVVFTEFRETAVALWRALRARGGIALLHGTDARLGNARASRRAVLERFAPIACGARSPPVRERVRVLIATDVLAEGLNLQDASAVISYDLPWNPIRIEQRIGRVDRLGSPHAVVHAFAFIPGEGVDALLGLLRRIRRKLRQIRHIGGDAPWQLGRRSARTGAAATILRSDSDWDRIEELRALYRERARTGCTAAEDGIAVAALADDRPSHAVLCCVDRAARRSLVLVRDGRAVTCDGAEADRLLLTALTGGCASAPDPSRVRAAVQAAARGHRATAPAPPVEATVRKAAHTVLKWLRARPGGATAKESATAGQILRWLGNQRSAAAAARLDQLLAACAPAGETVRLLQARAAGDPPRVGTPAAPPPSPQRGPKIRVVAALELVPPTAAPAVSAGRTIAALPRRRAAAGRAQKEHKKGTRRG